MVLVNSRLTPLQTGLLEAFFQHEDRFYLTGGGALAGFHLGHRETHALDLFALYPIMDDGVRALRQAARDVGASWREVRTAPEFRRVLLSREDDSVIVDLVIEHAEQVHPEKPVHGSVRVDPAEETSRTSSAPCSGGPRFGTWSTCERSRVSTSRSPMRWPPASARTGG